jgi:cytochrome oxidase Cu insertion factor (SCO1/SenC/PrrC family)
MAKKAWRALLFGMLACLLCHVAPAQTERDEERKSGSAKPEIQHPKVGEVVPDFTLKDVKGKEVKLSCFKEKKIFVLELGACT